MSGATGFAAGHALRKYDGVSYLKLEYDRAERLAKVRESNSSWADVRILRQLDYATANNGTDKRNGKLYQATANNLISTTTFPVVETYTYAGVGGRVSRRQTAVDGRTINLDLTFTDLGSLNQLTYPDDTGIADPSRTLSHTYAWGLLTAVTGYASSISYHPNLMVKDLVNANGVTWTQQIADGAGGRPHDAMGRPYSIGITGASTSWSVGPYSYDGAGNIKYIGSESFIYDKVLRLTSGTIVTGGVSRTQTASFNAFGFVTNLTTNGASQSFTEVSGTNRISGASYNAAGSMTAWGGYTYTWDPLNQMASVFGGSMTKRTFLYTADGERIEERVGSDPLSPSSIVLSSRGLDGKVLRLQTYASGTWSWSKDYVYRDGAHLASVESAGTRYFHLDHLGTIRRATNTTTPPAIVAAHDYYPFGYEATDPCQDAERMKWTGHERDTQGTCSSQGDDLDYMHARYENFNIGRFLSLDPVRGNPKRPQSFNLFAYARNNPILYTDPWGLEEDCPTDECIDVTSTSTDTTDDSPGERARRAYREWRRFRLSLLLQRLNDERLPSTMNRPGEEIARAFSLFGGASSGLASTLSDYSSDFVTGMVDAESLGLLEGLHEPISSDAYEIGRLAGDAWGASVGVFAVERGILTTAGRSTWFGRGGRRAGGMVNSNDILRVGWSWQGSARTGRQVFRIAVGSQRLPFHYHIRLWPPPWVPVS